MKRLILFFTITMLASCSEQEPQTTGLEGKLLPEFSLLLPDSSSWVNTRNIPTGKPIALFYFSPQCPYCRAQTKEILEDMDKLKGIQFYFITNFPVPALKSFYNEYQLAKYPNITSGVDTAHFGSNYFEMVGVPYIAIYGKDKTLNKTFLGNVYSGQIKKAALK